MTTQAVGVFSYADVIITLDDVSAGVACFGAPLRDGHGIEEVAPGILADGRQLERPVAEMLAMQARAIRSYARFIVAPIPDDDRMPITDPAARADECRAKAEQALSRGPPMFGHRVATPEDRTWHRDALARVGARFKAELRKRADPDAVDAWCADDVADEVHVQAAELREIAEELERLHGRVAVLDARRKAAHAPADLAYVRRCIEQNMVTSWGRVDEIAERWGVPCPAGQSDTWWLRRLVAVLEPIVAGGKTP